MREKAKAWVLPLVFLAGYMVAWGSIVVDRQMVIAEQRELKQDLERMQRQLQLAEMMQELEFTVKEITMWNKATGLKLPKKESAKNGKVVD